MDVETKTRAEPKTWAEPKAWVEPTYAITPATGVLIASVAALAAAVVVGALQAGFVSLVAYRLFRRRPPPPPPPPPSSREQLAEVAETALSRIGATLIRPAASVALALRLGEVIAIAYFILSILDERRAEAR